MRAKIGAKQYLRKGLIQQDFKYDNFFLGIVGSRSRMIYKFHF